MQVASPQIVELLIYFPNIYGLFTLLSLNCELQSKESSIIITGANNWTGKFQIYGLKQIIKEDNRV